MFCFFCDIQKEDERKVIDSQYFTSRFSEVPVAAGHCEIFSKEHKEDLFQLSSDEWNNLYEIIKAVKQKIEEKYQPNGYNIGFNVGLAGGQSQKHIHLHVIPRYLGDVENPRGGVRNVIPDKADYYKYILEKFPERKKYIKEN
ncbi:MAG: HIT family protein [Patescibacteria group bacterium]